MTDSTPTDDFTRAPAIVGAVLSAAPMLAYPFVLMANLMSFVAEPDPHATALKRSASSAFMVLSTAYPLIWIAGLVGTVALLAKKRPRAAIGAGFGPIAYLLLVVGAWWAWSVA